MQIINFYIIFAGVLTFYKANNMTYKELIYMILDEIKSTSDDSFFSEEHVAFLIGKIRAFLLKQRYADIKKTIPDSNYQTVCLNLSQVSAIPDEPCMGSYLKSNEELPFTIKIGNPTVYPLDYYQGDITFVSRDRMRYVGHNKYLGNMIYASIGPDNHLYLKSSNPQYLHLEQVKMTGIFEDPLKASELECTSTEDNNCDVYDKEFPLEDALAVPLIELAVKELLGAAYRPEDTLNNANDDLSDLAAFVRRNMKSNVAKQIEG